MVAADDRGAWRTFARPSRNPVALIGERLGVRPWQGDESVTALALPAIAVLVAALFPA